VRILLGQRQKGQTQNGKKLLGEVPVGVTFWQMGLQRLCNLQRCFPLVGTSMLSSPNAACIEASDGGPPGTGDCQTAPDVQQFGTASGLGLLSMQML